MYRQEGSAASKEGYGYRWQVETTNGRDAEIAIDGTKYDVGDGAVFLITASEKETTVVQIDSDLSQIRGIDDCRAFIEAERAIWEFGDGRSARE